MENKTPVSSPRIPRQLLTTDNADPVLVATQVHISSSQQRESRQSGARDALRSLLTSMMRPSTSPSEASLERREDQVERRQAELASREATLRANTVLLQEREAAAKKSEALRRARNRRHEADLRAEMEEHEAELRAEMRRREVHLQAEMRQRAAALQRAEAELGKREARLRKDEADCEKIYRKLEERLEFHKEAGRMLEMRGSLLDDREALLSTAKRDQDELLAIIQPYMDDDSEPGRADQRADLLTALRDPIKACIKKGSKNEANVRRKEAQLMRCESDLADREGVYEMEINALLAELGSGTSDREEMVPANNMTRKSRSPACRPTTGRHAQGDRRTAS